MDLPTPREWASYGDYKLVEIVFATSLPASLTATNVTNPSATLTIANHNGDWYYKANATPHTNCSSAQTGTTASLSGLTSGTEYTYKAYSNSSCTAGNLLATAGAFTTGASYASNLNSAKTGQSLIGTTIKQAVAFTTGSNANGYTLTKAIMPLRTLDESQGVTLTVTLHQMQGTGTYGTSSSPSATILATLTGTAPSGAAWADTTYTCSSGCSLSASTTYFVVIESNRADSHAWAFATTSTESTYPTNSGWDIGYAHDKPSNRPWYADGDYHPVRVEFTTSP